MQLLKVRRSFLSPVFRVTVVQEDSLRFELARVRGAASKGLLFASILETIYCYHVLVCTCIQQLAVVAAV